MKFFGGLLKYSILFLFVIGVFFAAYWFSLKPKYSGEISLPKLKNKVTVNFDSYGIPHIKAENMEDMYYSFGYLHAQERLFQMEMLKRLIHGRLSEIIGPDLIETDKYMRTLSLGEAAKKSAAKYLSSSEEDYQKFALAYVDGINEFIENGTTPLEYKLLGIEKEKFTTTDVYNVVAFMSLGFCSSLTVEPMASDIKEKLGFEYLYDLGFDLKINQDSIPLDSISLAADQKLLAANFNLEHKLEELGIPIWKGSNAWLISGDKTESGKPILANDTHIKFSQPSVYYEAHLSCPGYDFYGNFLAGFPFAVIGHNQSLGWGLTIFTVDNLDIYQERLNPNNENEVWINNQWTPLTNRKEIIKVKGQKDVVFDVKLSDHGPIVNDIIGAEGKDPISLHWVVLEGEIEMLEGVCGINHANTIEEFTEYKNYIDIIGLNVMYADTTGNIGWWCAGKVPLRNPGVDSRLILDGSDSQNEWLGYMDHDNKPHSVNPSEGILVSSNNNPYEGTLKIPGDYQPIHRASRVADLLNEDKKWKPEEMKAFQLDDFGKQHLKSAKSLAKHLNVESDKNAKILATWNGNFKTEEIGATLYSRLVYNTAKLMMEDEMGEEDFLKFIVTHLYTFNYPEFTCNENSVWWDNIHTKDKVETSEELIRQAWGLTLEELEKWFGSNNENWTWGSVHKLTHIHPIGRKKPFDKLFNVGPFALDGGNQVINKMGFKNFNDSIYQVISGPALRTIIDFSNIYAAQSINPTGQSGVVNSKHYQDQAQMFIDGEYRGQLMNWEEIDRVSTRLVFRP